MQTTVSRQQSVTLMEIRLSLAFSIENKPNWANFDPDTGTLSGDPNAEDVGITTSIVIKVEDGNGASASLSPFDLKIVAPDISISPIDYDFGNIIIGSTKIQPFTIINIGSADLVIESLSVTGTNADEFIIQNDNCSVKTIAPSETCTLEVKFSPVSTGAKSAILNIPSNDPDENPLNIQLTGSRIAPQPDILISPASCNFGNIPNGNSKTQVFTVTNTGSADLVIGNLSITGTDYIEFSVQNENCSGQPDQRQLFFPLDDNYRELF